MGFLTVAGQILIMFLLIGVGFLATRLNMLTLRTAQDMTAILLSFVSPALILKAFSIPFSEEKARFLIYTVLAYFAIILLHIILTKLLFSEKYMLDCEKRVQSQFAFVYSNTGFMGIPLLMALFGSEGIFYGATVLAAQSIFIWTHGFALMQDKEKKQGNPFLKIIGNPNILAIIFGIFLYFTPSLAIPERVLQFLGYLADLNTPMSMLVIGNSIANIPLFSIFKDRLTWRVALTRNILSPLLAIGTIFFLFPEGFLGALPIMVLIVAFSCPVAANAVMFSKRSGLSEAYPTKLVTLSTLLSALTIPLIVGFGAWLFPIG